jgi:hypothetical protein
MAWVRHLRLYFKSRLTIDQLGDSPCSKGLGFDKDSSPTLLDSRGAYRQVVEMYLIPERNNVV